MRFLESFSDAFIQTFGITQPAEQARRRAAWFIVGLLTIVLAVIGGGGVLIFHLLRT